MVMQNAKPAGDGYSQLIEVVRQIAQEQSASMDTHFEYATALSSDSIKLDKDGYPIYYDDGDYLVLSGVTYKKDDRLIVSTIGEGKRATVIVLGRWLKSTEVAERLAHPVYLAPAGGLKTEIVPHETDPTTSNVSAAIPFNRKWFAPESPVKLYGRVVNGGGSCTLTITDQDEGVLFSESMGTEEFSLDLSVYDFGDSDDNEIQVELSHSDARFSISTLVNCVLLVREP